MTYTAEDFKADLIRGMEEYRAKLRKQDDDLMYSDTVDREFIDSRDAARGADK